MITTPDWITHKDFKQAVRLAKQRKSLPAIEKYVFCRKAENRDETAI